LLAAFAVPAGLLPSIVPSSGVIASDAIGDAPLAGILGDQQAALFGQTCFDAGEAKNTYGTGCFLLLHTGDEPVASNNGMLTTVAYQIEGMQAQYALEGSVAIAGAGVQWLRDNLGLIESAADVEDLAASVEDNGGVYFVPAFSGLFAPWWRDDARGVIAGLTGFATSAHLARAVLEATAYQTRDVLEAMEADAGSSIDSLKVDGGMVVNDHLMQFQADILDVTVVRPKVNEATALGAAYAAGLAVGFWESLDELRSHWAIDRAFEPAMSEARREAYYADWLKAVSKSTGWV
jgi:glycerol kinase